MPKRVSTNFPADDGSLRQLAGFIEKIRLGNDYRPVGKWRYYGRMSPSWPPRLRLLIPVLLIGVLGLPACTTVPVEPNAKKESPEEVSAALFERAKRLYLSEDYAGSAGLMYTLAERGHLQAQYVLGYMYYYGLGVPRNEKEAVRWITTAAARGHAKAKQALDLLDKGESVPHLTQ
ncbi:hypothetical protein MNBD_GAMMA20-1366 [hydrothermal vent metagenome]|uniref:Sel1 repeat family protein n=1 Tax=hydrothermal vent metagenome TaxID=652676 RepID=A0A3B1A2W4_9ZZZZ